MDLALSLQNLPQGARFGLFIDHDRASREFSMDERRETPQRL
jgi:hypothetical protein